MYDSISVRDLKKKENINIIDIRDKQKYNNNHILDSINIPFDLLLIHPERYLNISKVYYIYCQRGNKSKKLCQFLANKGYSVVNIIGGYEAWILDKI